MGNSAIIQAKGNTSKAIYLHWNGGRDSVEAFLEYCRLRGFVGFEDDYGIARFIQVVANYFGGCVDIGIIGSEPRLCTSNGIYIVSGWEIVGREDFYGVEQDTHNLKQMLVDIDEKQPVGQQLGDLLTAEEVKTGSLQLGDKVYIKEFGGTYRKYNVVGFGEDKVVNGTCVKGLPYVNRFMNRGTYSDNINNYIRESAVRKCGGVTYCELTRN